MGPDHLGLNQRFGANAIDSLALATYGGQDAVSEKSVWPIFFSLTMGPTVVNTIRDEQVKYLLVDSRMTKGFPPTGGFYFSSQEPGAGPVQERLLGSGPQEVSLCLHQGHLRLGAHTDLRCLPHRRRFVHPRSVRPTEV